MSRVPGETVREKGWLAVLLAFTAGYVDGVGYIVLARMFTAHMSGNSIAMGVHVGQQDWPAAFHLATVWLGYVGGAVAGALAEGRWQLVCLVLPVGCLVVTGLCDLVRPLARSRG